jgi:hypothetical protein
LLAPCEQGDQLVLEQAILDLQIIERSIAAKTLRDLKIRLALRRCLKELRTLAIGLPCGTANNLSPPL